MRTLLILLVTVGIANAADPFLSKEEKEKEANSVVVPAEELAKMDNREWSLFQNVELMPGEDWEHYGMRVRDEDKLHHEPLVGKLAKIYFQPNGSIEVRQQFSSHGRLPAFVISSFVVLGKDGQTKELQVMGRIGNLNEFEYIQKVVEKLYHGNLLLPWTDAGKAELKKAEEKWEASPEGKAAAEADKKAALMPKPLTGLAKVRAEKAKAEADKQAAALKAETDKRARAEADAKAAAEAEEAKWRTWTDSTGQFTTKAKFGGMAGGKVKLIKKDGSTVRLPLSTLSQEDQDWLNKKSRRKAVPVVAAEKPDAEESHIVPEKPDAEIVVPEK